MFPDKVERLVIDAVVDSEDYYNTAWDTSLRDTSKVLQYFFNACSNAGPSKCAFYAETPSKVEKNLNDLYDSLKRRPLPIKTPRSYGLLDYARLRETIFNSLFSPWASFSRLAEGLAALASDGNGTILFMMQEKEPSKCSCGGDPDPYLFGSFHESPYTAIFCNDGTPIPGTFEDTIQYYEKALKLSEWSSVWAGIRTSCSGWKHTSSMHFRGTQRNFNMFLLNKLVLTGPITGNTADPVTPLSSARKMAKAFPGSVVLQQDSTGHASISAPSTCTQSHVKAYFINGTLPQTDTVCEVIGDPFTHEEKLDELLATPESTSFQTPGHQIAISETRSDEFELLKAVFRQLGD
ncbi:hypothetical protein D9758_004535 [Tetrapyrgos nigripes]|uniref:Peptidase S33 tripeptidyl aminopeptidase-like C-terminal domain-containing protein n=1 Tax=Tetrapyrgos nigripes TaxID=182062 RepID=A0A8H5H0A4_9AGAR|nr:hypothetical protein D9758_004535 [Tetrapyrgos nigripes]